MSELEGFRCQKLIGSDGYFGNYVFSKVGSCALSQESSPDVFRYFDFSKDSGSFDFYAKSLLIQMLIQIIKTTKTVYDHAW